MREEIRVELEVPYDEHKTVQHAHVEKFENQTPPNQTPKNQTPRPYFRNKLIKL